MKTANLESVTVKLSPETVNDIDRREKDRGKFIAQAVKHELARRRRAELRVALNNPHPESLAIAEEGFDEWARSLPKEDCTSLVNPSAGTPVQWIPGKGWIVGRK